MGGDVKGLRWKVIQLLDIEERSLPALRACKRYRTKGMLRNQRGPVQDA